MSRKTNTNKQKAVRDPRYLSYTLWNTYKDYVSRPSKSLLLQHVAQDAPRTNLTSLFHRQFFPAQTMPAVGVWNPKYLFR